MKYNTLRIIRQLPREGELWGTEGGEEDGGGLHCSGLDRDGDRHGADGGECGCNSRNAADRGISEMS